MLFRIPFNRLVITASTIGIIGSATCIGFVYRAQYKVLKRPYCVKAFELLEKNQVALELIGKPIKIRLPEVIDKKQKFGDLSIDIDVPFEGSKHSGLLHIIADREKKEDDWNIRTLECCLKNFPNKKLIVFKDV